MLYLRGNFEFSFLVVFYCLLLSFNRGSSEHFDYLFEQILTSFNLGQNLWDILRSFVLDIFCLVLLPVTKEIHPFYNYVNRLARFVTFDL